MESFLSEHIEADMNGQFYTQNTGGRGVGEQPKNDLLTYIRTGNLRGVHTSITNNLRNYTTLTALVLDKQKIHGSITSESPLCFAVAQEKWDIVDYLLGVIIYNNLLIKDRKGYYVWRSRDTCIKDTELSAHIAERFDALVQLIQSIRPEWKRVMVGGKRTKTVRKHRSGRRTVRRRRT